MVEQIKKRDCVIVGLYDALRELAEKHGEDDITRELSVMAIDLEEAGILT